MALFIFIFTILCMMASLIFLPTIRIFKTTIHTHWLIVLIGAMITIALNLVSLDALWMSLTNSQYMNPLKLVTLFIFLTIVSLFLDEVGFFRWLAYILITRIKGTQIKLFIALYALTSVLTIFTSNDVIILTLTPLIVYFARSVKINPLPYLFGILTASNTWSIMLIIGNPTNIYIGSYASITFIEYLKVMWLPAVVAGISGFLVLLLMFYKILKEPIGKIDGGVEIKEKPLVIIALIHLLVCIGLMAISSYIQIEMWLITVIIGLSITVIAFMYLSIKRLPRLVIIQTYKKAPWSFVPMILSMFVLVNALSAGGYVSYFGDLLNKVDPVFGYGISSHLVSNLMNNQPMSMLYAEILLESGNNLGAVYASIIGSNTGVLLTPFGALAGLMWLDLLDKYGIELSIKQYILTLLPVSVVVVLLTLLTLFLVI